MKTFVDEHSCCQMIKSRLATNDLIVEKLLSRLRVSPNITGDKVFNYFLQAHRVKLLDAMLYRTMKFVHKICEGEGKEQYAKLMEYAKELLRCNLGSIIFLKVETKTRTF